MRKTLLLIALLTATALAASAQDARLGSNCDLTYFFGTKSTQSFLKFDKELRQALLTQNTTALALLIDFPLSVNAVSGKYSIDDPQALQSQFQKVFPQKIREQIIHQNPATVLCNPEGISIGSVWVNHHPYGYAVETVNLKMIQKPSNKPHIVFVCRTKELNIIVDSDAKENLRYREWSAKQSILGPPDLTLLDGTEQWDGTDVCAVPVWTFKSGKTIYSVAGGLGCTSSDRPPPQGATGDLEINRQRTAWCY